MSAVLVTGSSGGIGRAICENLRGSGHFVVGIDRVRSTEVDHWIDADLESAASIRAGLHLMPANLELSGVVHNAATQPLTSDTSDRAWDLSSAMNVNVIAADVIVHEMRDRLAQSGGSVVAVSSVHAITSSLGMVAYAASKAALEQWTRSMSLELAPKIRVNSVRLGAFDTPKLAEGLARWDEPFERLAELEHRTPLERVGAAYEAADAIAFLLSSSASFITGSSLTVDGGVGARLASE